MQDSRYNELQPQKKFWAPSYKASSRLFSFERSQEENNKISVGPFPKWDTQSVNSQGNSRYMCN